MRRPLQRASRQAVSSNMTVAIWSSNDQSLRNRARDAQDARAFGSRQCFPACYYREANPAVKGADGFVVGFSWPAATSVRNSVLFLRPAGVEFCAKAALPLHSASMSTSVANCCAPQTARRTGQFFAKRAGVRRSVCARRFRSDSLHSQASDRSWTRSLSNSSCTSASGACTESAAATLDLPLLIIRFHPTN